MDKNVQQWTTRDKNGQQWTKMDNNGQQSSVLHASLMPFLTRLESNPFQFHPTFDRSKRFYDDLKQTKADQGKARYIQVQPGTLYLVQPLLYLRCYII